MDKIFAKIIFSKFHTTHRHTMNDEKKLKHHFGNFEDRQENYKKYNEDICASQKKEIPSNKNQILQ